MLRLEPRLQAIVDQEYPRFSDAEYARRHRALAAVMQTHDLDHLLVVTDHRVGNAPQWVTGWPGTVEAYVVFRPGEKMTMHVEWYNHFPLAKRLARDVEVRWGEHRGMQKTIEELKRRGARRVGLMGPLLARKQKELERSFSVVELDAEYIRLRTIKSQEEIDWLRIGAAFSDAGFESLLRGTEPGMTERELGNLVERAYVGEGGTTLIHYIGVTSMAQPQLFVPPQFHSARRVQRGDVVFCELSGVWWDYAGQVLRSFTVGADPTPLYRDLHAAAEAAFDAVTAAVRHGTTMQQIVDAAGVIEERGFTVCDDLMHGFGGGYLHPIVGTKSRPAGRLVPSAHARDARAFRRHRGDARDRHQGAALADPRPQAGRDRRVGSRPDRRPHALPVPLSSRAAPPDADPLREAEGVPACAGAFLDRLHRCQAERRQRERQDDVGGADHALAHRLRRRPQHRAQAPRHAVRGLHLARALRRHQHARRLRAARLHLQRLRRRPARVGGGVPYAGPVAPRIPGPSRRERGRRARGRGGPGPQAAPRRAARALRHT